MAMMFWLDSGKILLRQTKDNRMCYYQPVTFKTIENNKVKVCSTYI